MSGVILLSGNVWEEFFEGAISGKERILENSGRNNCAGRNVKGMSESACRITTVYVWRL